VEGGRGRGLWGGLQALQPKRGKEEGESEGVSERESEESAPKKAVVKKRTEKGPVREVLRRRAQGTALPRALLLGDAGADTAVVLMQVRARGQRRRECKGQGSKEQCRREGAEGRRVGKAGGGEKE